MPITPDAPFPKTQGDTIRSKDWNDVVQEVQRLDTDKLDRLGGGPVGIGTNTPNRALTVEGASNAFVNMRTTGGAIEALIGVDANGGIVSTMTNHDLQLRAGGNDTKAIIKNDGNVGIGIATPGSKLDVNGTVTVRDELQVPRAGGGFAAFSGRTRSNEADFTATNLKLRMGSQGLILVGTPPLTYQFMVGHDFFSPIIGGGGGTRFIRVFSVDQAGNAFFSGGKGGYVIDFFVNNAGDKLERGDVVVLARSEPAGFYGSNNNIPIPEVDLTDQAYDTRVCGIVDSFVPAHDLPTVEPDPNARGVEPHPLEGFGGATGQPHTEIADHKMGRMVTLGAWAHCKVDADIASIQTGDLLTTSPTKGHAQKVLDRGQGLGAIIGKAMAPLASGRATIPIFVMLQ